MLTLYQIEATGKKKPPLGGFFDTNGNLSPS